MAAENLDTAVLAWLGTYLIHSTLLLLAAWAACSLLQRARRPSERLPAMREGLWRVALLAGLATTCMQRVLDVHPTGFLWTIDTPASVALVAPVPPVQSVSAASDEPSAAHEDAPAPLFASRAATPHAPAGPMLDETETAPLPAASHPAPVATLTSIPEPPTRWFSWSRALLALWLAGLAFGLIAWAREWISLARCLRRRVTLDQGPAHALFARLCARTDTRGVRLSCAPGLSTPITLGLWRSEIVLPPRATTQLTDDELEALLAHELAHARRGDPLWLVIYRALEVSFFFQPLNRVARVRLQDEAELLADDWAVTQLSSRVSLASCLTEIAGWIVDGRRQLPAPAMAARGTRLSLRVRRLLDDEHRPERARRPDGLLILAGLAASGVALLVPGVATQTAPPRELGLELAPSEAGQAEDASDGESRTDPDETDQADDSGLFDPPLASETLRRVDGFVFGQPLASSLFTAQLPKNTWTVQQPDEWNALEAEFAELRAEAARRVVPRGLQQRLRALETQLADLRRQHEELESLLQAALSDPQPQTP